MFHVELGRYRKDADGESFVIEANNEGFEDPFPGETKFFGRF